MRHTILNKMMIVMIAAAAFGLGNAAAATNGTASVSDAEIAKKLSHEIRMYPRYTMFDNISFSVFEGRVELVGQVSAPYKKTDLGRIALHVAGVTSLANDLQLLPLSPMDDRLRVQVARAIYRDPVLSAYGLQAVAPIRIIVNNGHVTLEGIVRTEMEKKMAGMQAGAAGLSVGPVTNNLLVENPAQSN
jgi:hyperosmotically inducible periplasmic protein